MNLWLLVVVIVYAYAGRTKRKRRRKPKSKVASVRQNNTLESIATLNAQEYLAAAGQAHARGEKNKALAILNRAIAISPNIGQLYATRASIRAGAGFTNDVFEDYRRAIVLNPADFKSITNLGVAFTRTGRHEEALKQFDAALKIDPAYEVLQADNFTHFVRMVNFIKHTKRRICMYRHTHSLTPFALPLTIIHSSTRPHKLTYPLTYTRTHSLTHPLSSTRSHKLTHLSASLTYKVTPSITH